MRNYRQEFSDFSPTVYLDCAYQGPFPHLTVERIQRAVQLKTQPHRLKAPEYFHLPDEVRARFARIAGATTDEIAIMSSATQGIGIAAAGLNLGEGDEVVVASSNFPSNLFSWLNLRRKGVAVKVIQHSEGELTPDLIAAELTDRTRVLALDWVNYSTGYRIDLEIFGAMIHQRDGIFVVDGTQGVGANSLNLTELPVDIMAVAAYKWLLGPYGTGFAYFSTKVLKALEIDVINWHSVKGAENFDSLPTTDFTLVQNARIFDVGETGNFMNMHGLDGSMGYVEEVTVQTVHDHCRKLLVHLEQGLRERGYTLSAGSIKGHESTIACFYAGSPEATKALHQKLAANNISVSLRHGMIRVSPYLYNDQADIDRLLEVIGPA